MITVKAKTNQGLKRKVQVWVLFIPPEGAAADFRGIRVLVLKTRRDRGGFWQPVTGGVESGETSLDAALREAIEETGLTSLARPQPLPTQGSHPFRYVSRWGNPVIERGYWAQVKAKGQPLPPRVKIDPSEHVDYEWLSIAAARRKIYYPSNRKLLDLVAQRIRQVSCSNSTKLPRSARTKS